LRDVAAKIDKFPIRETGFATHQDRAGVLRDHRSEGGNEVGCMHFSPDPRRAAEERRHDRSFSVSYIQKCKE
jgi:hypothetical protein